MPLLTATITTPNGTPVDAMLVVFARPNGTVVTTSTDACGGLTLEATGSLALTVAQPIAIEGTVYDAGTILRFAIPDDADDDLLTVYLTVAEDASPTVLLARIAALTDRVAALEGV